MIGILAAGGDVPSWRAILFGALIVAGAGVTVTALWKLLAYAAKTTFKSALTEVFGDEFTEIRSSLAHLHDCFERRIGAVESRESSALLVEIRRIADGLARAASPSRVTDPVGADHRAERALPPSES